MDEYPVIDLSHLLPAAQGLARLPADERIQRIRADRWIGYPRAVEALNRLETLYACRTSNACQTCCWSAPPTTASR